MTPPSPSAAHPNRLAVAIALLVAIPVGARAASFTVLDDKAAQEIVETTRLYIDGRLVADFSLDDRTTHKRIRVSVPDTGGPAHQYALCGAIAYHTADGRRQVRQVSGQGSLPSPDGHVFMAVGADDFTRFFLIDPTDRDATSLDPQPSPFCQAPIS